MTGRQGFGFYRDKPAQFIADVLRNPATGKPFALLSAEREFLSRAFTLNSEGGLLYPELVYAAIKKSGKSGFAAMLVLYVVLVLGGPFAEGYVLANDLEQSQTRVYTAIRRIVEASPLLRRTAAITANKITFAETGATITAIAADYAGAAGGNPCISVFDELWGFVSERSRRLWDEMIPPPTRQIACRLTTTYAGFEGESELLMDLHKRGMQQPLVGPDLRAGDGMLMFWSHEPIAPWQSPQWLAQMRNQLRPNAYLRMIENRWVTGSESFITMQWWDDCVDHSARPLIADKTLPIWVGVDASVKRDSTAIVAVHWDRKAKNLRLINHRIFQPSHDSPLDFEGTIEKTLREFAQRFKIKQVNYDPYQMQASAQRLRACGIPMVEYPQTVPGLTATSTCLFELIKSHGLVTYPDDEIRLSVSRAVALETSRGWRIAKEKQSHRIDVVVALSMAAYAAVEQSEHIRASWGILRGDGAYASGFYPPLELLEKSRKAVEVDEASPQFLAHRQQVEREAASFVAESQANIRRHYGSNYAEQA